MSARPAAGTDWFGIAITSMKTVIAMMAPAMEGWHFPPFPKAFSPSFVSKISRHSDFQRLGMSTANRGIVVGHQSVRHANP